MNPKKIAVYALYILVIALSIGTIKSCAKKEGGNTPTALNTPQVARAYTLYTNDPKMDMKGSSRVYHVVGVQSDWISLSCNEKVGQFSMIIGKTLNGRIGFNPQTLIGVWSVEFPNQGWAQTGPVSLKKNSYGGFDLTFYYDDGRPSCTAKFLPVQ